jgi:hypothetical protein
VNDLAQSAKPGVFGKQRIYARLVPEHARDHIPGQQLGRYYVQPAYDGIGGEIAAHGVDGYGMLGGHYLISKTRLPPYEPHARQILWGAFGSPHALHRLVALWGIASWARRMSRRDLLVFFFGTAILNSLSFVNEKA